MDFTSSLTDPFYSTTYDPTLSVGSFDFNSLAGNSDLGSLTTGVDAVTPPAAPWYSGLASGLQSIVGDVNQLLPGVASIVRATNSSPTVLPVGQGGAFTTRNGTTYAPIAGTQPQSQPGSFGAGISGALASVKPYFPFLLLVIGAVFIFKLVKKL